MWDTLPTKAKLSYLFEKEVDKIAEWRTTLPREKWLKLENKYKKEHTKYIYFNIDTSKILEIIAKGKRPYLVIKIISLKEIQAVVIEDK